VVGKVIVLTESGSEKHCIPGSDVTIATSVRSGAAKRLELVDGDRIATSPRGSGESVAKTTPLHSH
jgi:hypothetical protein